MHWNPCCILARVKSVTLSAGTQRVVSRYDSSEDVLLDHSPPRRCSTPWTLHTFAVTNNLDPALALHGGRMAMGWWLVWMMETGNSEAGGAQVPRKRSLWLWLGTIWLCTLRCWFWGWFKRGWSLSIQWINLENYGINKMLQDRCQGDGMYGINEYCLYTAN